MASVLSVGDVLLLQNGEIGVIRNMYESKKYNTCVVELKGKPTQIVENVHNEKTINKHNNIRIKVSKNNEKHNSNIDYKKLTGEQLFDKLFVLHELINEEHIHRNKYHRLKRDHHMLKKQIKQQELKILDLRDALKLDAKYLLLQQSIYTLTHPKNIDKTSAPVFLLTYPTFTNSVELMENLANRFFHLNQDDHQQKLCQWEIQIKVISLLQRWIRTYWIEDFYFNAPLTKAVDKFTDDILAYYDNNMKYSKLSNMIQQTMQYQWSNEVNRHSRELEKRQTFSLLIEEMKSEFQDIDNRSIAEQMTLIDFNNFEQIKPRECLNNQWMNEEQKYNLSPNICEMIDSLNKTFKWTKLTILLAPTVEARGRLIKKCLKICRHLLKLNNFHSLSGVFGALRSSVIWKLKDAWKLVPHKHMRFYDETVELFNTKRNFKHLRAAHKSVKPPMVPYTGIFLSELVGIEESTKVLTNNKHAKKAINFQKLVKIAQSIDAVLIYQKTRYEDIKQNVPLQHFLRNQIYDDIHLQMEKIDEDYIYKAAKSCAKQDAEDSQRRNRSISNHILDMFTFKKS